MTNSLPFTWTCSYASSAFDPREISNPSQIPDGASHEFETQLEMRLTGRARPSYSYHWLREVALGVVEADFGMKVACGVEAILDLRLNGRFRAVVSLDADRWLRLRIAKSREQRLNLSVQLAARVTDSTELPAQANELTAAILGVHPLQLVARLVKLAEKGKLSDEAVRLGIEEAVLKQAMEYWRSLDPTAATAAWAALSNGAALVPLIGNAEIAGVLLRIKSYADEALSPVASGSSARIARSLAGTVGEQVAGALEKICAAELDCRYQAASDETALIDCSFDFTPEGLRLYREALDGSFTRILTEPSDHARLAEGVLTHAIAREPMIELHLPFVGRKEWKSRLESLARVEVETTEDGRILVYSAEASSKLTRASVYQSALMLANALRIGESHSESNFKLSYSGTQTLGRVDAAARLAPTLQAYGFDGRVNEWLAENEADEIESNLTLAVPGGLVETWLRTPGERDAEFFPVFSRVSVAVQTAMRRALPHTYFRNLDEYETLASAYALLVYQASKPFAGRPRSEFTYDVMEDRSMASVYRSAAQALPQVLEGVSAMLAASGRSRIATFYAPRQTANILASVQRNPRLLRSLLVADAHFVGALVELGLEGRRLAGEFQNNPQKAVKSLSRFTAEFVQSYHSRLRRLYAGRDFPALGAMVLVEATAALAGATGVDAPVSAVLRLKAGTRERTFVNAAYRG